MTTTIDINGKAVQITLTAEQVAEIKKASTDVKERVKTYEDACREVGIKTFDVNDFNFLPFDEARGAFALHQLSIIRKALNQGWEPDWSDHDQCKYYAWFRHGAVVGSGFSYRDYACDRSTSHVGSRLCFSSAELAEYAGKQFLSIYKDFLTL